MLLKPKGYKYWVTGGDELKIKEFLKNECYINI